MDNPLYLDKRTLRELVLDFYTIHDPQRLRDGIDINGMVNWTFQNGLPALNEMLFKNYKAEIDPEKKVTSNNDAAFSRVSAALVSPLQLAEDESRRKNILERLRAFYQKHDTSKLSSLKKLVDFAMYRGVDLLNHKLMDKYGETLDDFDKKPEPEPEMNNLPPVTMRGIPPHPNQKPSGFRSQPLPPSLRINGEKFSPLPPSPGIEPPPRFSTLDIEPPPRIMPEDQIPIPSINAEQFNSVHTEPISIAPPPPPPLDDFVDPETIEGELTKFYTHYDPGKLEVVEALVAWVLRIGRIEFNNKLEQLYGACLDDEIPEEEEDNQTMIVVPSTRVDKAKMRAAMEEVSVGDPSVLGSENSQPGQQQPLPVVTRGSPPAISPRGVPPAVHPRGPSPPVIAPRGQPPVVSPRGQPPAVSPRGQPPAVSPRGQPPAVSPRGQPPAVQLRGPSPPVIAPRAQPPVIAPRGQPPPVTPRGQPPAVSARGQPPPVTPRVQPPAITTKGILPTTSLPGSESASAASLTSSSFKNKPKPTPPVAPTPPAFPNLGTRSKPTPTLSMPPEQAKFVPPSPLGTRPDSKKATFKPPANAFVLPNFNQVPPLGGAKKKLPLPGLLAIPESGITNKKGSRVTELLADASDDETMLVVDERAPSILMDGPSGKIVNRSNPAARGRTADVPSILLSQNLDAPDDEREDKVDSSDVLDFLSSKKFNRGSKVEVKQPTLNSKLLEQKPVAVPEKPQNSFGILSSKAFKTKSNKNQKLPEEIRKDEKKVEKKKPPVKPVTDQNNRVSALELLSSSTFVTNTAPPMQPSFKKSGVPKKGSFVNGFKLPPIGLGNGQLQRRPQPASATTALPPARNKNGGQPNWVNQATSVSTRNNQVQVPQESEAAQQQQNGPCNSYRLDMTGKTFGVCVCGYPRHEHKRR